MHLRITGRLFALTAAVLCAAALAGSLPAAAETDYPQRDDAEISVIVKVAGDPVLAAPAAVQAGKAFLDSDAGKQLTAECKAVQHSVQERIRSFYPELEPGFSYTALFNGFSCKLPESLIAKTEALPDVISVTEAETVGIPMMNRAVQRSGFPVCYDKTGCSGEGQVIAVIDTELDTSHPMFAPLADDIETAVSREDIAEIVSSGVLNADVDPDRVYLSSKLPYAADYLDSDPYGGVPDPAGYHGTHVSGIAAGNAYTANDGAVLSGIAKDAQLMFFACGKGGGISVDAAIAGFEDAVRLHADVITISWGSGVGSGWDQPFSEAVSAADRAGIIVCGAAGNAGSGTDARTPENPDTGTISNKAELGSPMLIAGSADNPGSVEAGCFFFEGERVICNPVVTRQGGIVFLTEQLPCGDYAYADCGTGTAEAMRAGAPEGKLALVQAVSGADLDAILLNAENCGALGVIVIGSPSADSGQYTVSGSDAKLTVIGSEDGRRMLNALDKTLTVTGETVTVEYPAAVSDFSSWGVRNSLDLRPDILGIGGRVRSAAYNSGDAVNSGTSMAAPYVAGSAAVVRQYLMQQGITLEGDTLSAYIRRLMMNTAVPYEENGVCVSPRRQGAGLVSLDRAAAAKVLMNGPSGEAKVNLFDRTGSSFAFWVEITNYSGEDVVFPEAELRLTTDGTQYRSDRGCEVLSGQQPLRCTADISGPVMIPAGQTENVTVHAELDAEQYAALSRQFRNGFFIEGYLMLSGAENSADISIPLLGFSGDWVQLPVAAPDQVMAASVFGNHYFIDGVPLVEYQEILQRIRDRVPDSVPYYERLDLKNYATEEEQHLLEFGRSEAWISPNGDGIADFLYGLRLMPYRNAAADLELCDAEGNLLFADRGIPVSELLELTYDQSELPDGDYTLCAKAGISYEDSAENPQVFSCALHVDRNAPEVSVSYREQYGRKLLTVTASDDRKLQGMIVTGWGSGGVAGTYRPGETKQVPADSAWYYGGTLHDGLYPRYFGMDEEKAAQLPLVLRQRAGIASPEEIRSYNFCDYVCSGISGEGTASVEYDVTDLEEYSITVLDCAYNIANIRKTDDSAEKLVRSFGSYQDPQNGIYTIGEDSITFYNYYDGTVKEYRYTAELDLLTLTSGSETLRYLVRSEHESSFRLTDMKDSTVSQLYFSPDLQYFSVDSVHPINEIMERAAASSAAEYGKTPLRTEIDYISGPHSISFRVILEEIDGTVTDVDTYYNVSIFGSRCVAVRTLYRPHEDYGFVFDRSFSREVNLFAEPADGIPAGLYYSDACCCDFLFSTDGRNGMILYAGSLTEFRSDEPFSYSIGEDSSIELCIGNRILHGRLSADSAAGTLCVDLDSGEMIGGISYLTLQPVTDDEAVLQDLPAMTELTEAAAAYLETVYGFEADSVFCNGIGSDQIVILDFQSGEDYYSFCIDPQTMTGSDSFGCAVDLRHPQQQTENAYSAAQLKRMAENDCEYRTGTRSVHSDMTLLEDGRYSISFLDEGYELLDEYLIDSASGRGTNLNGEAIDLPQTGVFGSGIRGLTAAALLLTAAGAFCCAAAMRRKEQN